MDMDKAFQTFIEESNDLLTDMEDRLLDMENDGNQDKDTINSIFRAVHTIKGSAGLFGLSPVVEFTHNVESVLDNVRADLLAMDYNLISLLLECKDHISKQIDSIVCDQITLEVCDTENEANLASRLLRYLSKTDTHNVVNTGPGKPDDISESDNGDNGDNAECINLGNDNWHISVKFDKDVLRNGMDPLSFLRYLNKIGHIENIITLYDEMPDSVHMDPESCYLHYEINYQCDADKKAIEDAFEFVKDDCVLHIIPPSGCISEFIKIIESLPDEDRKLGEILVSCGTLTQGELDRVLDIQAQSDVSDTKELLGQLVVNDRLATPQVVEAGLNKQENIRKSIKNQNQTLRIDAEKLDHLINLIGELVIAGSSVESEVRDTGIARLQEASLNMNNLIEEVRDSTLNLRMVQIGDTFHRFQRVVRDLSKELDKEIELEIAGAETELDKTIVERISDPLMHIVRNAIDHGIESVDTRMKHNKPAIGHVRLNAYHESSSIVIEVSDDGGGLNRDSILRTAIEKGLTSNEHELPDSDIYQFIFNPGFSTADHVSNISGRGVGMDVVRRNIEALRGTVEIESQYTHGTTIRIRLPLTLAIIDGFMMGVGSASYVVPLEIVEECMELTHTDQSIGKDCNYINLRGEVLPFIRLREHFSETGDSSRRENIVVVRYGNQKAGFVVDTLKGELQTVIKPLGKLFEKLHGISGSTILGSGEVALILDTPALIQQAVNQ